MQRLLSPEEAAQVEKRLHDNALLHACQRIWPGRQEDVTLMVCAEDIFCEAAWLMDELIDADEDTDSTSLTYSLWSTVFNDVGRWGTNVSNPDRYLIASTVFRLVATAFSLHWHTHYCDTLRDVLLTVIDEKRPKPHDLPNHQEQERQQDELTDAVIGCSAILDEWVNGYIDDDTDWCLTDEIERAIKKSPSSVPISTEQLKSAIRACKEQGLVWAAAAYAVFYRVMHQDHGEDCGRSKFEERMQLMGFTDCKSGTLDQAFHNNMFLTSRIEKWPEGEGRNKNKAIILAEAFRKALKE